MIQHTQNQDYIDLCLTDSSGLDMIIRGLPFFHAGWVWLVGAGPGDVGLLTLHAVQALRQADVILYDALVSQEILELATHIAEKIYVGKRGGRQSWKQEDISDRLVALAGEGKRVLRLKGGDPFVFARGAEEAEALLDAGILFRIVPGITAGIGALEYAGIPVTHRKINHAVTFVTGHSVGTGGSELLDWHAISQGSPVIVCYMAMRRIEAIVQKLLEAGRMPDEPVAIILNGTLSTQKVIQTHLSDVMSVMTEDLIAFPSVIVIGKVAQFGEKLDWFSRLIK